MANSTKLGAVIDKQIIKVFYRHDHDNNVAPSRLNFTLNHHYTSKAGNGGVLSLDEVSVPIDFIKTGKTDSYFTYESNIEFVNPKYYTDLSVSVSENYMGSGPAKFTCDVLNGDNDLVVPLPVNPIRPPQFEENEPPAPLPDSSLNVIEPEPVVNPYLFSLSTQGISAPYYSSKILYKEKENVFYKTEENLVNNFDNFIIENGITNFIKNASFFELDQLGSSVYPKYWDVEAPGFIVSSGIFDSDLEGVNSWHLHVTNPNSFSALDSIALKTSANVPIGTSQLTFSFRYQQFIGDVPSESEPPFENLTLKNTFLAQDGSIISQSSVLSNLEFTSDTKWADVSFSFVCPTSCVKVDISLETSSITTTKLSTFKVLLPQLENCFVATTPCLTSRKADQVTTPKQISVSVPVGFVFETTHSTNPEIRGIFELNEAGFGGLRAYLSGGRLNLRQVDSSNSIVYTAQSLPIPKQPGSFVRYCIFIEPSVVSFYADGALVSSSAAAMNFAYESAVSLGGLFATNTSINSVLKSFTITTVKPG